MSKKTFSSRKMMLDFIIKHRQKIKVYKAGLNLKGRFEVAYSVKV
jgi:hypothetical protein